jgi:hypothetical protein
MTPPKLLFQVRELLKEYSRTYSFKPLHDHTYIYMRSVCHQYVNVVAGHFAADDRYLMFHGYLPYDVAHPNCHFARQYLFPIFWDPYQMDL